MGMARDHLMGTTRRAVVLRKLREEAWDAVWIKAEDLLLVDWGMARDHLLGTTRLCSRTHNAHILTHSPTYQGKLSRSESKEYVMPMYPPGELVFLRKLREEAWDAVWIKAEDLMDEGLLVDWGMARDHLLGTTLGALETAARLHSTQC